MSSNLASEGRPEALLKIRATRLLWPAGRQGVTLQDSQCPLRHIPVGFYEAHAPYPVYAERCEAGAFQRGGKLCAVPQGRAKPGDGHVGGLEPVSLIQLVGQTANAELAAQSIAEFVQGLVFDKALDHDRAWGGG